VALPSYPTIKKKKSCPFACGTSGLRGLVGKKVSVVVQPDPLGPIRGALHFGHVCNWPFDRLGKP